MKLLIDENLSERLISTLEDLFPGSLHPRLLELGGASDEQVWSLALQRNCVLLTKDEDFLRLSLLRGAPPKVVWLRLGNCSTAEVTDVVRSSFEAIRTFHEDSELSCLELRRFTSRHEPQNE